jgi:hypothetical protein
MEGFQRIWRPLGQTNSMACIHFPNRGNREFLATKQRFPVPEPGIWVSVHFSHTCIVWVNRARCVLTSSFAAEEDEMSDDLLSRERYGESFWRKHYEACMAHLSLAGHVVYLW